MSIDKSVCELVRKHWKELQPSNPLPESLVFLKVAGKTSADASIIALVIDGHSHNPVAVAKIPRNPQVTVGIECEYAAMTNIKESISDSNILDHVPYRGTLTEINDVKILLQTAAKGDPMVRVMTSQQSVEEHYKKILPWMISFHSNGAEESVLEGEALDRLVESPIKRFVEQYKEMISKETHQFLTELPDKVKGRKVQLCRQHGDFNAHNILLELDGNHCKNFTLIDWEDYRTGQLPIHDLNHFFTSNSYLLGAGKPPEESYANLVLNDGWYHDLYLRAIADYETGGLIDKETFMLLTPLYFIEMCFRIADVQRQQQHTASTWVKRLNVFCSQ